MEQITVSLDDRLANVGDTLACAGHIGIDAFELSDRSVKLPNGMDYDLMLTNAGEGILATGIVRALVSAECDRCLDDTSFEIAGEVDEYYLFSEPDAGVLEEGEEEGPDFSLIGPNSTIDLTDAIVSAFVMEIPFVILCREDCAGLCPVCGENLNHVDCGHAEQIAAEKEEERISSSPFAALRDLDLS
ncbi:MAG: DUF177 domain-containing protein [Coriobacteriales bacterium]|nr:DUF177 domain-containing protein [Coriobacteriales bacterium]